MPVDDVTQGRLTGSKPVAVIDIGSNTIRLVVYEGLLRSPTPLFQEKIMGGLGRFLPSTNRLNVEAVPRALEALARFRTLAEICGVAHRDLHPFATAAVRWAQDGPEFLEKAEAACGVPIRVVDNIEEASLAATGVLAGFRDPRGVVGDLGGGSLELIGVNGGAFTDPVSLPLGGLALIDKTRGEKAEAQRIIEAALAPLNWLEEYRGETLYAVGGTWRALAKLHMHATDYPLSAVHGYRIDQRRALQITARYANSAPSALARMDGMSSGREETLPFGALLMHAVLRRMQPDDVVFSAYGVREGYLYRLLDDAERHRDPLMSACEDVARLRSRSSLHGHELSSWVDPLFTLPAHLESEEERRLRRAACILSDIAWRAHPDYRGEQSAALIAQSALVGLDHPGRAFLALCVYHRYERKLAGELLPKLATLVPRRLGKRALVVGQAVRLAHTLSAGMAGVLPQTSLAVEGQKLVLSLPRRLAALDGETLRRRLRNLAREAGVEYEIRNAALGQQAAKKPSLFRSLMGRSGEGVI